MRNGYKGITIVSPMIEDGMSKNQDRARWYEQDQSCGVCDGVSSSPESAKAAELAVSFIPSLFNGNTRGNLELLCDLLIASRNECQDSDEIIFPEGTLPSMREMLRKVVREKRSVSYQTTMIAAKFVPDGSNILADIVKCGDSALFAFSPDGQLLTSSMAFASLEKTAAAPTILFGPGDEILVRIEGKLSSNRTVQSSIPAEHAANWLVCTAVDLSSVQQDRAWTNSMELKPLPLNPGDQLLVPKYLYGTQLTSQSCKYAVLRYSSTIKPVFSAVSVASAGSVTTVLPDHFYCGCYDSFQDRFPHGTNFILCSDGFYNAFSTYSELWLWLNENKDGLHKEGRKEVILAGLHAQLRSKSGDDDISFIWAIPERSS